MTCSLNEVKRALDALDIRPSKRRGQNFLVDHGSRSKIIAFADVRPDETVLEVGPGLAALSEELIRAARSYIAIEIEQQFAEYVRSILAPTAKVIHADARDIRVSDLNCGRVHLVSNVPYSFSSEISLWAIANRPHITHASLLFQREFAERLAAKPGSKEYGSLSVLASLYADLRLGPRISGTCFFPSAEVESRLIELRFLPEPRMDVGNERIFEEAVRASFATRRKTLLNALSASRFFESKVETERQLRDLGIDPGRRAETLTLAEYAKLSRLLTELVD